MPSNARSGLVDRTTATSPGARIASGLNSSASATLNIAALTPMPIASERIAVNAKPGDRRIVRTA